MFFYYIKTQYLPIVPKSADAIVDKSVIRVGTATITASLCVQCLDMKKQVSQAISACSFHLSNINQISRFLPRPTKESVVNAFVARVATVPHPCYANSTGCPLCAELTSSYLYSLTKPCTTTRQCICVNSCARINRQEHCALRTTT